MYRNACIQTRDIHKPKVKSEQKVCVTERVTSARGPCERVREKREALPPLPFSLSALGMLVPKGPQSRPPDILSEEERGDYANLRASLRGEMKRSGPGSNESADT